MTTGVRLLAVVVSILVFVTGPLAPLAAAQQPPPAQPEPGTTPLPPQRMPEPTTTPLPAQRMPEQATEPLPPDSRDSHAAAYNVGAGIANVFYIPGKCVLCAAGVGVGVFIMLITIGSQPRPAAYFAREGCGGRWILRGNDIRPEVDVRAFDWERDGTYKY
jgi:hypothetical protein